MTSSPPKTPNHHVVQAYHELEQASVDLINRNHSKAHTHVLQAIKALHRYGDARSRLMLSKE